MEATKETVMPAPVKPSHEVLTAEPVKPTTLDTCDRCGAAALLHVMLTSGNELYFCGHHGVKYGFADPKVSHAAYREENRQQGSSS